jgi:hypothetical protein
MQKRRQNQTEMKSANHGYLAVQSQVLTLADLVQSLDLEGLVNSLEHFARVSQLDPLRLPIGGTAGLRTETDCRIPRSVQASQQMRASDLAKS